MDVMANRRTTLLQKQARAATHLLLYNITTLYSGRCICKNISTG